MDKVLVLLPYFLWWLCFWTHSQYSSHGEILSNVVDQPS